MRHLPTYVANLGLPLSPPQVKTNLISLRVCLKIPCADIIIFWEELLGELFNANEALLQGNKVGIALNVGNVKEFWHLFC